MILINMFFTNFNVDYSNKGKTMPILTLWARVPLF